MFERLRADARRAVVDAQGEARRLRHNYVGTEHLLLALLANDESLGGRILRSLGIDRERIRDGVIEIVGLGSVTEPDAAALDAIGIDLSAVRRRIEDAFGPGALERTPAARAGTRKRLGRTRRSRRRAGRCSDTTGPFVPLTPKAKKVLELSLKEALSLRHSHIGSEHIMLGLLREGEGVGARLLERAGVDYASARLRVLEESGGHADSG